eukprot:4208611-Alexandrium_andersonii.AAC.1
MAAGEPSPPLAPASGPVTPAPAAVSAVPPPPMAEEASAAPSAPPASEETVRRKLSFGDEDLFDLGDGG